MSKETTFVQVINMMLRKWWLILIAGIVFAAGTYIMSKTFITPMYKTDGSLYVNAETEASSLDEVASSGRLNSSMRLAATYAEILKRRGFLEKVADVVGGGITYQQISPMISVQVVNDTEIIEVSITSSNPQLAYTVLGAVLECASDELLRVVKAGSVEVIDQPYVPQYPISPNNAKNGFLGGFLGVLIAMLFIFLKEMFDSHIKGAEEMKRYEEPLLGEIPCLKQD